ncbi:uncharacterized protein LOC110367945 [Fundulus heteroclitus]|uniref:uncharacterized protein LOC110367945 n=1 Tax=Fundulus heteroclitus TaxID=8078 RepID=UPI00165AE1EB|nr:uncharacterized protein LOC110367945 [Fundulus heteroclitus]
MDEIQKILLVLCGLISWSHCSMLENIVQPGDNVTINCDCKVSTGVYIVWFRNCSHEYQPTLVHILGVDIYDLENKFPQLKFLKNETSDSYDLVIINVTNSDEGLYYCGTFEPKVENDKNIAKRNGIYTYGNITTRITLYSMPTENCGVCWKLLISLCPAVFIVSTFFSFFGPLLCCKTAETPQDKENKCDSMRPTQNTEGIHVAFPKQKKTVVHRSDFREFTTVMYNVRVED